MQSFNLNYRPITGIRNTGASYVSKVTSQHHYAHGKISSTSTSVNRGMRLSGSGKSEIIPGIGDEGCALPSPSGVNMLPLTTQTAVVFGIFLGLYAGTVGVVSGKNILFLLLTPFFCIPLNEDVAYVLHTMMLITVFYSILL